MRAYYRIISYGRKYWWMGLVAFGCLIVYTFFNTLSLLMIGPFVQILFGEQTLLDTDPLQAGDAVKSWVYRIIIGYVAQYGALEVLPYFCIALFVVIVCKNAARYLSAYLISPLEQGIIMKIRERLFHHLTTLGLGFYTHKRKGDVIGTLVSDIQVVQESVISTLQSMIREPLTIVFFIGSLFMISWKLTLFTLTILPLTAFLVNIIRQSLKRKARLGQKYLAELIAMIDEFVSGIRIVKAFQKEAFERERYDVKNRQYTQLQVTIRRKSELASPISEIISIAVICIIIVYGGNLILSEGSAELTGADFITFIALFSQVMAPLKAISGDITKIQRGIASFDRIEDLLGSTPELEETPQPLSISDFKGNIAFQSVYFKYETDDILSDITFSVSKGQMVAIVGPSGAGKSTLVDLLPRYYDPYQGQITIDGTASREYSLESLRGLMGAVTQEPILFHDTVFNNIAYGIPNTDPEAVREAAKIANADQFIQNLPEGYNTLIGERGTRLSGGQRQRLAIARAVLRNPPILILDEATSNLDTESERLVQDALEKLMANRTSFVIAHRLSTILKADLILVMNKGRIVEQGTHQALMELNGLYRKLYDLQFAG